LENRHPSLNRTNEEETIAQRRNSNQSYPLIMANILITSHMVSESPVHLLAAFWRINALHFGWGE
jgi:hypothetical protein